MNLVYTFLFTHHTHTHSYPHTHNILITPSPTHYITHNTLITHIPPHSPHPHTLTTYHTLPHSPHSLTQHTPSHNTLPHTQAILNPLQGFFNAIAYGGICQTFCSWLCTKLKRKDPYVSSWSGEYIDVDFRVSRGRIHCSRRKIST